MALTLDHTTLTDGDQELWVVLLNLDDGIIEAFGEQVVNVSEDGLCITLDIDQDEDTFVALAPDGVLGPDSLETYFAFDDMSGPDDTRELYVFTDKDMFLAAGAKLIKDAGDSLPVGIFFPLCQELGLRPSQLAPAYVRLMQEL